MLIDPECKFKLRNRAGQKDLTLTYDESEYRKYYPFYESYEKIKNLMTQKDLLIFGHAVYNDIIFLAKACRRYNLPLFDYTAYDIQSILPVFSKQNRNFTSLNTAFNNLVPSEIRNKLMHHRACDDAMQTMLVFKAMVKELEFTTKDLIDACPKSEFKALEYWEQTKARYRRKDNAAKRKEDNIIWGELCSEHEALKSNPDRIGKIATPSNHLKGNHDKFNKLIKKIKAEGYIAQNSIDGSNYFVTLDEQDKEDMQKRFTHPYGGKMVTLQEFLEK